MWLLWRTLWRCLKKLKIELPCNLATPLLGKCLKKTIIQKDMCTSVFTAALLTIARTWRQPECASTKEWIKKMWRTDTPERDSAIKEGHLQQHEWTWRLSYWVKSAKQRQISWYCLYVESLKSGTNECIYKMGTASQTQKTNLWFPRRKEEIGVDIYTLLHIK